MDAVAQPKVVRGQMSTERWQASTFAGKLWLLNNRGKTSETFARPSENARKQARVDLTCWIANAGRLLRPSSRGRLCCSSPLIRPCSSFNSLLKTDTPAGSLVSQRLPFLDSFSHDLSGQSVHLVKHLLAQTPVTSLMPLVSGKQLQKYLASSC